MPNFYETLSGELYWARTQSPELKPFKNKPSDPDEYQWKVMLRPDQASMIKVMDLQAKGCKNKLGKDEKGYTVNFNRPTVRFKKPPSGPWTAIEKFEAPKVTMNGSAFADLIGNGSKGNVVVEVYEHKAPGGKTAHAARLHAIEITELVPYGSPAPATSQPQGWPSNT